MARKVVKAKTSGSGGGLGSYGAKAAKPGIQWLLKGMPQKGKKTVGKRVKAK